MKFTIYSGCYNSASFIDRLFTSIKSQTYRDFEWIVFDDYSQDNTIELIKNFIYENENIAITFIKNRPNKGIKYNYLEAMRIAKGMYFLQWDHDDIQKPNQLEIFSRILGEYDNDNIAGVWALCEDQYGNVVGKKYPGHITVGNYFSHFRKYITKYGNNVKNNERMPCIKISKFRQLEEYVRINYSEDYQTLFPTFRWALLSIMGNSIVYVNEVVRVYFIEQGVRTLSKIKSPSLSKQLTDSNKHWINLFFKYLDYKSMFFKFNICKSYIYHGINSGQSLNILIKNITHLSSRLVILTLYLPVLLYSWLLKKI